MNDFSGEQMHPEQRDMTVLYIFPFLLHRFLPRHVRVLRRPLPTNGGHGVSGFSPYHRTLDLADKEKKKDAQCRKRLR